MESLNLWQKINEIKKVVKTFTKDASTSGSGAYTYTSGTQILSSIKEKMEELQVLLLPITTEHQEYNTFNYKNSYGYEKTDFIVVGKMVYEWINAEKPDERQRVDWQYYGQQNDISKAFGSGLTYSERYILLKSLGVPTDDEDPDAKTENKAQVNDKEAKPSNNTKSKYKQAEERAKANGFSMTQVGQWIKAKYGKEIKVNDLEQKQFDELMIALENGAKKNEQVCGEQGKQVS